MKKLMCLICVTMATLIMSGCTGTKLAIKTPNGDEATLTRWTFCNTTELPELDYTNGVIRVRGLKAAPDKDTVQLAADVAAKAAVKALTSGGL